MFNALTIADMQRSVEILYTVAREQKDVNTPSAVARVLNISQQTLKNWESRGISRAGAMRAQEVFGVDSNVLLAADSESSPSVKTFKKSHMIESSKHSVTDSHEAWLPWWPFTRVTVADWNLLTNDQRAIVEGVAASYIKSGDPPLKQPSPEQKRASG